MKAKLADLSIGIDGQFRLTITTSDDCRQLWDDLRDGEVRVDIKKWHSKRSLTANAYAWVLIDKLAEVLNMSKVDVYRQAIQNLGGVSTIVCVKAAAADELEQTWKECGIGWFTERQPSRLAGCVNVTLYYGSSVYDTKQMGQLIDRLIEDCKDLNIETIPPAELAALKESWR